MRTAVFAGASWFFNKSVGLNAELGFNLSYARIGMIFRIP